MKTTAYYINLEADLSARNVYYKAYWAGKTFTVFGKRWVCYDKPEIAAAEFDRVLATLKPQHFSGCYQLGIWAEEWQDDELVHSNYIETYQTPAFAALQDTKFSIA